MSPLPDDFRLTDEVQLGEERRCDGECPAWAVVETFRPSEGRTITHSTLNV